MIGCVGIPMSGFRSTARWETMFWLNMKNDEKHKFKGAVGIDDEVTWDSRMLLKYSILEETVVNDSD